MSALFTDIVADEADTGITRSALSSAVSVWVWMNGDQKSVADTALTFNTTPELVRQAVDDGYWTYLDCDDGETDPKKQIIRHDGE